MDPFNNFISYLFPSVEQTNHNGKDSFEEECICQLINSFADTIARYPELKSQNKWDGRISLKDFEEVEKRINDYSKKFGNHTSDFVEKAIENLDLHKCALLDIQERSLLCKITIKNQTSLPLVSNTKTNMFFTTFPEDIQKAILFFLAPTDLLIINTVSKKFNEIANDELYWKSACESKAFGKDKKMTWKGCYIDNLIFSKKTINVNIRILGGTSILLKLYKHLDSLQGIHIKEAINRQVDSPYKLEKMRLILSGNVINDNDIIVEDLAKLNCLHLIIKP